MTLVLKFMCAFCSGVVIDITCGSKGWSVCETFVLCVIGVCVKQCKHMCRQALQVHILLKVKHENDIRLP